MHIAWLSFKQILFGLNSYFLLSRFLGAIKQYLCLSLLKNSASTLMIVYQLSCSIFMSLVSRFRSGLKAEIGVFFPMIVLRVLENVAQPNFQQKMIVLRFLDKLCVDSQILVDIFVNYDCDVHSPNIFERYDDHSFVTLCTSFLIQLIYWLGTFVAVNVVALRLLVARVSCWLAIHIND